MNLEDRLNQLRLNQTFIADSSEEPTFHVTTSRGEWYGGWQALADWIVIERPRLIRVTVDEWDNLAELDWDEIGDLVEENQ